MSEVLYERPRYRRPKPFVVEVEAAVDACDESLLYAVARRAATEGRPPSIVSVLEGAAYALDVVNKSMRTISNIIHASWSMPWSAHRDATREAYAKIQNALDASDPVALRALADGEIRVLPTGVYIEKELHALADAMDKTEETLAKVDSLIEKLRREL